jgi:hypothetical protein
MSLHSIDDLLADPLIQAVMKADRVEPAALKSLLTDAAVRLARPAPRPLAINAENVRFSGQRRAPLRIGSPAPYKSGETCLYC